MNQKNRKKGSFIRTIAIASMGYLFLMIIILSAVWWNTGRTLENGAESNLNQAKEIFGYEMDEILKSNEQALAIILQDSKDITAFDKGTEIEKSVAAQNILQLLKNVAGSSADVDTIFFYDLIGDTFLSKTATGLSYSQNVAIEETIKRLYEEYPGNMPSYWFCEKVGNKNYLLRLYKNKKRMLGALVDVTAALKKSLANDSVCYLVTDENGNIIAKAGSDIDITTDDIDTTHIADAAWSENGKFFFLGSASKRGNFLIFVAIDKGRVFGAFQLIQVVILVLILSAIFMLIIMTLYARNVVYMPLKDLMSVMKRIENGEQNCRLPDKADTVEFMRINDNFNHMMDTIVNLRMKSYEERIQFDEATLKYVQLQIKPHFFLNALTTIHSMSFQDRNDEIRDYIERLSRNIRYLFRSGLHTVKLSEEIEHVRDYIAMQDILYPGCVFEFIDVDEKVSEYPIPQLLIHTMLENTYKHAVSVDKLTSILISCKLEVRGGESMCHITVEDDGQGFPEEFLSQVRDGNVTVKENGHGVGLWNMKKTLKLMYKRDDLMEFSNKEPNGSRVDMWIPRRVKRQSSVWKLS